MRIWSLHPEYLDMRGLSGAWREALLAKAVLENKTKGYRNHPQLSRFKNYDNPLKAINCLLFLIRQEGCKRGYKYSKDKIDFIKDNFLNVKKIPVTVGQVEYETKLLLHKLSNREQSYYYNLIFGADHIKINPLFTIVPGDIESWERLKRYL